MQHAVVFLTAFAVVVVATEFLGSFLLSRHLVRLIVYRRLFEYRLRTFTKVLEVT